MSADWISPGICSRMYNRFEDGSGSLGTKEVVCTTIWDHHEQQHPDPTGVVSEITLHNNMSMHEASPSSSRPATRERERAAMVLPCWHLRTATAYCNAPIGCCTFPSCTWKTSPATQVLLWPICGRVCTQSAADAEAQAETGVAHPCAQTHASTKDKHTGHTDKRQHTVTHGTPHALSRDRCTLPTKRALSRDLFVQCLVEDAVGGFDDDGVGCGILRKACVMWCQGQRRLGCNQPTPNHSPTTAPHAQSRPSNAGSQDWMTWTRHQRGHSSSDTPAERCNMFGHHHHPPRGELISFQRSLPGCAHGASRPPIPHLVHTDHGIEVPPRGVPDDNVRVVRKHLDEPRAIRVLQRVGDVRVTVDARERSATGGEHVVQILQVAHAFQHVCTQHSAAHKRHAKKQTPKEKQKTQTNNTTQHKLSQLPTPQHPHHDPPRTYTSPSGSTLVQESRTGRS